MTLEILLQAMLVIVTLINALPLLGLLSAQKLEGLYGISMADKNLVILLKHRAVLFGIVAGLIAYSIFEHSLRDESFIVALVSMASFIIILWFEGGANKLLKKVAYVDGVGLLALGIALVCHWSSR